MGLWKKLKEKPWGKIWREWLWMLEYIRVYRVQVAVYTLLGALSTGLGLVSSVVSKHLIDSVTGFDTGSIGLAASLYVGLGVGCVLINALTGRIALLIERKVSYEISGEIFDRILHTDWQSVSRYNTGDLLVRLNEDVERVSNNVLTFLPSAVNAVVSFLGAFVIICLHDPWMAVFALAGAPVTVLTGRYRMGKLRQFQRESQKMSSRRMAFHQETFHNLQSIKAFGLLERFSKQLRDLQQDMLALSLRQYRYQAMMSILMSLTGLAVSYGCFGFAAYRLWQGSITFGTMMLFLSLSGSLTNAFSTVVKLVPTAVQTATSAERIIELLDLKEEQTDRKEEAWEMRREGAKTGISVCMEQVSFRYEDGRKVYENACLKAEPGEIIALAGPSGQGKTTTLRLLLGLVEPTEGQITVKVPGGRELEVSPSTRCLFSYVPQRNTMFSGTIAENLRMIAPDATDQQLRQALETACSWEFVSQMEKGMDTCIGEEGHGLSEGQKQRLSIARAILSDAPILLMDEATSALDQETERRVLEHIMRAEPHRTIIVTAHRPSVLTLCHRCYRIEQGSMKEE